jgi:hypothetical protein
MGEGQGEEGGQSETLISVAETTVNCAGVPLKDTEIAPVRR